MNNYDKENKSTIDYYPFGQEMPGRVTNTTLYRYGFNGKENDNEVAGTGNWQNYGMREYDARVCRFISVDPLTMDYPELTPFQFASDSPIENIDLDGLEKQRYNHRNYVKRDGVDNNVVNQNNDEVKSNGLADAIMNVKSAFSINHNFKTNLVPAGQWKNDPQQYNASRVTNLSDNRNEDETIFSLDNVNPDAKLRQLWYSGTRSTSFSPAYMDIDALMPGGYKNLFNSNTFAVLPDFLDPNGDLKGIDGEAQYVGGMNTMFRNGIGMTVLSALTSPVISLISAAAVALQQGVNPAYSQAKRIKTTSYITHVSGVSVSYQVKRFQRYINSTNTMTSGVLRPRWHRGFYGQPNSSTK